MIEAASRIGFIPDVIHCNDWQTGLIPILLRTQYGHWDIGHAKTIFTIHNMMYQGEFGFDQFEHWLESIQSMTHQNLCITMNVQVS